MEFYDKVHKKFKIKNKALTFFTNGYIVILQKTKRWSDNRNKTATEKENSMKKIKFYGIGGQGAVTAAKILSEAVSLYQGEYAVTIPAYGHERRGAPVYAHVIVDDVPVLLNCYVYEPDIVLVMDEMLIDKGIHVGEGCNRNTVCVLNTSDPATAQRYKEQYQFEDVYYCDATGIAEKVLGVDIPNSAMLGALAKTGVVRIEAVEAAVRESFGKVGEKNAEAARTACAETNKA